MSGTLCITTEIFQHIIQYQMSKNNMFYIRVCSKKFYLEVLSQQQTTTIKINTVCPCSNFRDDQIYRLFCDHFYIAKYSISKNYPVLFDKRKETL